MLNLCKFYLAMVEEQMHGQNLNRFTMSCMHSYCGKFHGHNYGFLKMATVATLEVLNP